MLPPEVSHHARVTRVAAGDQVEVLDLAGAIGLGTLVGWDGKRARVQLVSVSHQRGEPPGPIVVGLGILHTQAFDWATEKLTELGATQIVPLLCERVQGRQHEPRVERWQRLAEAAVAQCGRSRAPVISPPRPFAEFLSTAEGTRLVAEPSAGLPRTPRSCQLADPPGGTGRRAHRGRAWRRPGRRLPAIRPRAPHPPRRDRCHGRHCRRHRRRRMVGGTPSRPPRPQVLRPPTRPASGLRRDRPQVLPHPTARPQASGETDLSSSTHPVLSCST